MISSSDSRRTMEDVCSFKPPGAQLPIQLRDVRKSQKLLNTNFSETIAISNKSLWYALTFPYPSLMITLFICVSTWSDLFLNMFGTFAELFCNCWITFRELLGNDWGTFSELCFGTFGEPFANFLDNFWELSGNVFGTVCNFFGSVLELLNTHQNKYYFVGAVLSFPSSLKQH